MLRGRAPRVAGATHFRAFPADTHGLVLYRPVPPLLGQESRCCQRECGWHVPGVPVVRTVVRVPRSRFSADASGSGRAAVFATGPTTFPQRIRLLTSVCCTMTKRPPTATARSHGTWARCNAPTPGENAARTSPVPVCADCVGHHRAPNDECTCASKQFHAPVLERKTRMRDCSRYATS